MYICICRAITDTQIKQAIHDGCHSCAELMNCLKAGTECGRCHDEMHELLASHLPTKACVTRPVHL
jgi:bacterioferritin-associated ferredoxin